MAKRQKVDGRDEVLDLPEGYYTFDGPNPFLHSRRVVPNTTREEPLFQNPLDYAPRPAPDAVLRQESRGLRELVKCDQIPRETVAKYKDVLEKMGFKLLKPTEGDELFHDVTIPDGWTKQRDPEDHRSMFFCDDKGNARFLVWYKAASYDRSAYGYPLRRFEVQDRHFNDYTKMRVFLLDRKNRAARDRVVFTTELRSYDGIRHHDGVQKEERAKVIAWATSQGMDLDDPLRHWEDEDLPTVGEYPSWNTRTI